MNCYSCENNPLNTTNVGGVLTTKKYMLISVCDREIMTERFNTIEEARAEMHKEMIEFGRVTDDIFDHESYEDYDCGFGEDCGYANDGVNHADYDWRIVIL